jgi:golgi-specific brefeldin A-resistance guanine nucleotide exchange factor 1
MHRIVFILNPLKIHIQPFLDIVTSPLTTGPITGAALSSLHKFLLYGFVRSDSLRAAEGINLIAQGISKCLFEETDNYSDEVVLMKVLELSALCVRCDVGTMLKCEEIVLVFNKCLSVSKEDTRRSSLLRRLYIHMCVNMIKLNPPFKASFTLFAIQCLIN